MAIILSAAALLDSSIENPIYFTYLGLTAPICGSLLICVIKLDLFETQVVYSLSKMN